MRDTSILGAPPTLHENCLGPLARLRDNERYSRLLAKPFEVIARFFLYMAQAPHPPPLNGYSLLSGAIVSVPAAMAVTRLYTLLAEVAYRWRPQSSYSRILNYLWLDPGMRGDVLLVFLFTLSLHFVVYPNLFRHRDRSFHVRYLALGTVGWLALTLASNLILRSMGSMQSPM